MMRDPFSQEAEQSLLGAMLIKPQMIDTLAAQLKPSDFYWPENAQVFQAITDLRSDNALIDYLTVSDKVGNLEGGDNALAYCAELHKNTPSAANATAYAKIVLERSIDRAIIASAQDIHDIAHGDQDSATKVAAAQASILAIGAGSASSDVCDMSEMAIEYADELQRREDSRGKFEGLETGIKKLDERLKGIKPEEVIVVAGRAKMGKTTFAMGIVRHNLIRHNKRVLVFSLEMSKTQLLDRIMAAEATVSLDQIQGGYGFEYHQAAMGVAFMKMAKSQLVIVDKPGMTIGRARGIARKEKYEKGLDLILIDHLGLLDGDDSRMDARARISDITRQTKLMAKELKTPVILVSQLNRALESRPDKRPIPSDLRESGTIEQDADAVLFVHREEYYDKQTQYKGIGEIILGIARSCEPGTFHTHYEGQYNRFRDLDPNYIPPEPEKKAEKPKKKGMF